VPSSCLYSNSGQLFDSSVCDYSLRFLSGFHTARTRPAVWRTHVGDTKNPVSASSIPVLPVLKKFLDSHRARVVAAKKHSGADDDILAGERRGAPLKLANLVRRVIMPALAENEGGPLQWMRWHAFRRSLATNLHSRGVSLKRLFVTPIWARCSSFRP